MINQEKSIIEKFSYFLIFLFYITFLLISHRNFYFIIPTLFSLFGLVFIVYGSLRKLPLTLSSAQLAVILTFVAYSIIAVIEASYHRDDINTIKFEFIPLVLVPAFLFFCYFLNRYTPLKYIFPLTSIIVGIYAIYDKFILHTERAFQNLQPVIPAAGVVMVIALFCFTFAFRYFKTSPVYCIYSFIAGILGLMASILTGSRGAWLCFPVVFISLFYAYRKNFSNKFKLIIIPSAIILFVISLFVFNTGILLRLEQIQMDLTWYFVNNNPNSSIGLRFEMWKSALHGFIQKPFLGWGDGGYMQMKIAQVKEGLIIPEALPFTHAHNQFLDVLVKKGILQLLVTLLILFVPLKIFINHLHIQQTPAIMGIITIFSCITFSLSDSFFRTPLGMIFYCMTIYLLLGLLLKYKHE